MGELRRRCASCGESYAEGVIFCPRDGSALVLRGIDNLPDPYLQKTLLGEFRVEALIGVGAVGRVYRAVQLTVDRHVALKIMHQDLARDPALQSRFRREARLAGSLNHPNLVSVLSLAELAPPAETGNSGIRVPFLVLEYLDGLSLRSALSAQGALPVARTLHILLQIADAVGEAHQRGIVHRDLKPENVMLVQRGEDPDFVKVLDFGVARAEQPDPSLATHAGAIFGSARYVAPECAAGGASSPASDVYALATLAYECLAGKTPFDGENAIQILLKQQNHAPPPLYALGGAELPTQLKHFVTRNLAKEASARAADARVFARELLAAARGAGLDPGLTSRTRRGHAAFLPSGGELPRSVTLEDSVLPRAGFAAGPEVGRAPTSRMRRALFVLLCFAIGSGAALLVATKLGAFRDNKPAVLRVGLP
ncbi:MAG: serine/threonine-protein kinase [Pseudomonadota bacterium]